jgi:hypothetical protein
LFTKITSTLVCLAFFMAQSKAQTNRKNEIGLLLGATVTPQLKATAPTPANLEIGSGITFQLTYARQLSKGRNTSLYLEVPALAVPLQNIKTSLASAPRNYDSFFVAPGLRLKLVPDARISPWLSAGGGYALFDESAERVDGTLNLTRGTSGCAVQFGGGIDMKTPIKVLVPIGVRLEARDFYTSKPTYNVDTGGSFQHSVVFSGGLVLRF